MSDSSGATSIEYALIAVIVSLVIVTGATSIGTNLGTKLSTVATSLR